MLLHDLKRAVVLRPEDAGARYALAEALFGDERIEDAVKQLERALLLDADHADARRLLARAYQRAGRLVPAERTLEEAVRRRPDDAGARDELAGLLADAGRADDAILHLEEACRADPDSLSRRVRVADLARRRGLLERARRHLAHAQRLAPGDAGVAERLAELALETGDGAGASPSPLSRGRDFLIGRASALLASPALREAAAAGALREVAVQLGRRDLGAARRALVTARPEDQATAAHELVRAELTLLDGDLVKAERAFRRCVERAPAEPLGWSRLGEILAAAGRPAEALPCFERLRALAPDDAEPLVQLGDALLALGRRDEALARLREALARSADGALAARVAALEGPGRREDERVPGRIGALGWNAHGGAVSVLEAAAVPGKGELVFTGKVGKVGQDAARVVFSCLKARAEALGIEARVRDCDLHLHFVDTESEKDGPSAGLALALAGLSAYTRRPLRPRLAATGEITLHGAVRSVGGLHEKLVAAYLAGVEAVIVPRRNLFDIRSLPQEVVRKLEIVYVDSLAEALEHARGEGPR